jgi:hypothetical protein
VLGSVDISELVKLMTLHVRRKKEIIFSFLEDLCQKLINLNFSAVVIMSKKSHLEYICSPDERLGDSS